MNDRFEHELSQFLDGRLPSGRRDQILEQIAEHADAADLLEEMEQAQDLAQSLSTQQIGRSFSETLWERIRAGEGTPDAVFREPLPFWTKARYVASGAAAAAALIVALQILDRGGDAVENTPTEGPRVANSPAGHSPNVTATGERLQPRSAGSFANPIYTPIVPQTIAQAGQFECVQAVSTLQERAPEVERRIPASDPRDLIVELDPVVGRVRGAAELLRWMQDDKIVKLGSEFDTTLALTEGILQRLHTANRQNDAAQLRVAVQDLQELQVDRLRQSFDVVCCADQEEFLLDLRERIRRSADVRSALRIVFTTDGGPAAPQIQLQLAEPRGADLFHGGFVILRSLRSSGVEIHVQVDSDGVEHGVLERREMTAPRHGR